MNRYKKTSIKDASTKKKIGFFSSVILVICSSVGAGIFIKNHEILQDTHGAIIYALLAWAIAIIGILGLAMALAEICSGSGHDNQQGIIGWVRTYCNKFLYLGSKNFMTYLHLPIYFMILPIYLVIMLQQAFGFQADWYWLLLLTIAISSYFIVVSGISAKMGNIQSWVTMCAKFLPIGLSIIGGFITLGIHWHEFSGYINWSHFNPWKEGQIEAKHTLLFRDQTAILGILSAIPAIFLAFDGFYATAGIQTMMKEPKKVSMSMAVGISIVSAIDILITLGLVLSSYVYKDGTVHATGIMADLALPKMLIQIFQIFIAIGILGILNGFAIYSSRYYTDLVINNEIPFAKKLKKYVKNDSVWVGVIIGLVLTIGFVIIFGLIGSFAFINSGHYSSSYGNHSVCQLYSLCDVIGNWNAILAFVCIVFAIVGCLINRFKKKVVVKKSKFFIAGAIISISIVGVAMLYYVVDAFGNLGIILRDYNYTGNDPGKKGIVFADVIGAIMQIVVLVFFIGVMFIPAIIRCKKDKSIKNKSNDVDYKHEHIHEQFPEEEIMLDIESTKTRLPKGS